MYTNLYHMYYLQISKAVTQVWAELVREISDSMILPLDVKSFSDYIDIESRQLLSVNENLMKANNLTADVGKW